jgi:SAM-dependent methyltransferase
MGTSEHDPVVRQSFEQQVGLFTGEDSPFARSAASTLAWLEPLDADMIVLDVACGAAHVAEQAALRVRQVVGVDLTPALLRLGADRLRQAGVTNVLLQEGNAAELPFVDASFDVVVCRSSLHHFPSPEQPVAEMTRVCRPGGCVIVSDMVAPTAEVRGAFDELHRRIDPSHAGALTEVELGELLRSAVGPLSYAKTSDRFTLPVDQLLTDAADRDAVMVTLRAELAGGPPTGFNPVVEDDQLLVSFANTVLHATRLN